MSRRRESHAFRKGFILGILAGAGAMLWNAPQPGERTREQIMETLEGTLFKLLDAPEKLSGVRNAATPDVEVFIPTIPEGIVGGDDIVIDGPRPSELTR
jgi:hypothetical protein